LIIAVVSFPTTLFEWP